MHTLSRRIAGKFYSEVDPTSNLSLPAAFPPIVMSKNTWGNAMSEENLRNTLKKLILVEKNRETRRTKESKIGIQVLGEYSVTSVIYTYYYSHDSRRFDTAL
jgi:hypothetical protein